MINEATQQTTNGSNKILEHVETLDLTAMQADDLANIEIIRHIGTLIIPESLTGTLANISVQDVGSTVSVPDGKKVEVRTMHGPIHLGGEALVNDDEDTLTLMTIHGPVVFTTPVTTSKGYQLIVHGPIFAPEGSGDALGRAIRQLDGPLVYYKAGGEVKIQGGQVKLNATALTNPTGDSEDILLLAGQITITGEVKEVGYKQVYLLGQALIPKANEAILSPYLQVFGQVIWYSGEPRALNGNDELGALFFDYLEEPATLIINGTVTIQNDVTSELLRAKVSEIFLNGTITAPSQLIPMLQALTKEKNGAIEAEDADEESS